MGFIFCWHDWNKWEDCEETWQKKYFNPYTGERWVGNPFTTITQIRSCKKCGKKVRRRVA